MTVSCAASTAANGAAYSTTKCIWSVVVVMPPTATSAACIVPPRSGTYAEGTTMTSRVLGARSLIGPSEPLSEPSCRAQPLPSWSSE